MKRFIAFMSALLLTLVCMTAPVSADSIFDDAESISLGKKFYGEFGSPRSTPLKENYRYCVYKINVPNEGMLQIDLTSSCEKIQFDVYDSDYVKLELDTSKITSGSYSNTLFVEGTYENSPNFEYDHTTKTFKGTIECPVKKGTYYLSFFQLPKSYIELYEGKFNFTVNVNNNNSSSNSDINCISINMKKGNKINLGAFISGKSSNKLKFKSSNKKVAKIDSKGNVTAISKGTSIITVQSGKKSFQIAVVVK